MMKCEDVSFKFENTNKWYKCFMGVIMMVGKVFMILFGNKEWKEFCGNVL